MHFAADPSDAGATASRSSVTEVFSVFLWLGLTSFGGPIAHIAYFHAEFVERRRWMADAQFSQLLALAQFLPGPASSQLGFAIGTQRAGALGGLAAFVGFTLPSAVLLFALALATAQLGGFWWLGILHGLKLVAVVVVADGLLKMARQLTPDAGRFAIAGASAAIALWQGSASAQLIALAVGAAAGLALRREATTTTASTATASSPLTHKSLSVSAFALLAFLVLLAAALGFSGSEVSLVSLAAAFARAGALVFGGGHVVLPLLEESVVATGWLSSDVFLTGYGAAQAVPGPMFSVAAYLGAVTPWSASPTIGTSAKAAAVAVCAIFLPGFLLLTAALPLWQRISANASAARVIMGVNAAVVGLLAAAFYSPVLTRGIVGRADVAIVIVGFVMHRLLMAPALWLLLWCLGAAVLLQRL